MNLILIKFQINLKKWQYMILKWSILVNFVNRLSTEYKFHENIINIGVYAQFLYEIKGNINKSIELFEKVFYY